MQDKLTVQWFPISQLLVARVAGVEVARSFCKDGGAAARKIARDWQEALGYSWDGQIRV